MCALLLLSTTERERIFHLKISELCSINRRKSERSESVESIGMEKKRKKMVWFWPEKHDGGGVIEEAEDEAAEHISIEGTMSHYSFSKGLLPPLGVNSRASRNVKLRCFIVSPFDPRYRSDDLFA